jgi:hypothetical protein
MNTTNIVGITDNMAEAQTGYLLNTHIRLHQFTWFDDHVSLLCKELTLLLSMIRFMNLPMRFNTSVNNETAHFPRVIIFY